MTYDRVSGRAYYARRRQAALDATMLMSKYDAPCCAAKVDDIGRYPVGYCSPGCERRDHARYAR